ncbi:ABC transporter permease [Bifidobacterium animalis subsp. animalis]|uniref:ABC transporter permease n=1 Tax=Bifidobacterium animalis TaxID=28025 RepID=UPI001021A69F|nr:ABC transporter permease [Bifidobacterium animalis]RYN15259.1 ABC transporter permease [Bifidobacterium animalis subsp. animalis]
MRGPASRAAVALTRRWRRNLFSLCAVLFCAATFVTLQGITLGTSERTAQRFVAMETGVITATLPAASWERAEQEVIGQVVGIPHVENAGTLVMGDQVPKSVTAGSWGMQLSTNVAIGTMGGLHARGARLRAGLPLADGDVNAVLLGERVARELGIGDGQSGHEIAVDGVPMRVAGIVEDAPHQSALATSIVMTPATARRAGLLPSLRVVQIGVEQGTANQVAQHLPMALAPEQPQAVSLKLPADPRSLRESLMADAEQTTLIITVVMVVVSIFTVVNTMQIAITERRREIGISLGLGMPAWHIALQFLLEAMLLGLCGGLAGMTLGSLIAATIAMCMGWQFMLPWSVAFVPFAGAIVGAVGALVPAAQATRINPAELLRSN